MRALHIILFFGLTLNDCEQVMAVIAIMTVAFLAAIAISVVVFAAMAARMARKYATSGWIALAFVYGSGCVGGLVYWGVVDFWWPALPVLGVAAAIAFWGGATGLRRMSRPPSTVGDQEV